MEPLRLWPDEYEDMRAEAREMIAAGMGVLRERLGRDDELPADRDARVAQQRAAMAAGTQTSDKAVDRTIEGVRCRTFLPDGEAAGVYLHFHGGGMVLGSPEMSDLGNAALADNHSLVVVSVDYRKAPEHPHPAGPDDAMAVTRWLLDHAATEFGSGQLIVGGESAGGFMAAITLLRVRDELGPEAVARFLGANLVFGVYDWGRSPSQRGIRPHDGLDMLTLEGMKFFGDCYLPGLTDDERRAPDISPAFADLSGLVPALMSVGTTDHLLDDTLMLASRWAAAGNPVELAVFPDCPHGFQAFPTKLTAAWARRTNDFFSRTLAAAG